MSKQHWTDGVGNSIDTAYRKKDILDAILPDVEHIIKCLLDDLEAPIEYNTYDTTWECLLCSFSVRAIEDPPGHVQGCDVAVFTHSEQCPVTRARKIRQILSPSS